MHFVNGMHLWHDMKSLVSVTFKMGITHAHISAWKHTWCCSQTTQEASAVLCKLKTASEKSLNCASLHTTHSCPACVLKYNRSVSLRNIGQCSLHSVLYLVWFEGKPISGDWPPCHHSRTDSVSRKPPDPSVHPPRSEIIRLPKMELCLWHHVSFQFFFSCWCIYNFYYFILFIFACTHYVQMHCLILLDIYCTQCPDGLWICLYALHCLDPRNMPTNPLICATHAISWSPCIVSLIQTMQLRMQSILNRKLRKRYLNIVPPAVMTSNPDPW